jgi:hypothetical protein
MVEEFTFKEHDETRRLVSWNNRINSSFDQ